MVNGQMIVRIIQYLDPGFDVMATMPIRWNLQGPAPVSHTVVRTDRALMMLAQNVVEYGLITAGNKGAALFTSRFAELGIVSGQILAPQVAIGFGPIGDRRRPVPSPIGPGGFGRPAHSAPALAVSRPGSSRYPIASWRVRIESDCSCPLCRQPGAYASSGCPRSVYSEQNKPRDSITSRTP